MNAVELSKKLLEFKTITPIDEGCLDWIANYLETLGFQITWLNQENIKNLLAVYKGPKSTGLHLCFAGHTDVVPTGNNWTYPPFAPTIHNGLLYARGTADMKCTIACWIAALQKTNLEDKHISILLTSDEEAEAIHGLRTTVEFLKQQNIDLFILGEPTSIEKAGDCIKVGRRGSVTAELICYGQQGHIAYPQFASNPLDILDEVYEKIKNKLANTELYPFGACKIVRTSIDTGNKAENMIPGVATMRFGIRFNTMHTTESIKQLIEEICQANCKTYELKIWQHGNPFITSDQKILDWINQAAPLASFDAKGATSDGRFLSAVAPVIECGFLEMQAHQVDEHVSLEDIATMEEIYINMIKNSSRRW